MSLTHECGTIVSLLADLARDKPDIPLYTMLDSARDVFSVLTSSGLQCKAQQIAARLQAHGLHGEPVLVVSAYGPEFIELLFGVMLAGCMPVPVTFHRKLGMVNIAGVVAATGLRAVTGQTEVLKNLQSGHFWSMPTFDVQHRELSYLPIDDVKQANWHPPRTMDTDAALIYPSLQGDDIVKPTVLTHRQLLSSVDSLAGTLSAGPGDSLMTCHDLADGWSLVLHILLPLRAHCRSTFYPVEFAVRDAEPWMRAASHFNCTMISAPPAVLSQAGHQAGKKSAAPFYLSNLRYVCVDGGRVVPGIISRFIDRYDSKGAASEKVMPLYGLSESCTFIADRDVYREGRICHCFSVDGRDFRAEDIESLVLQSFGARGLSRCVVLNLNDIKQTVLLAECATRQLADHWQGVVRIIMDFVQARTDCRLDRVILLRPGSLPLATSAAVSRQRCAAALADGSLMLRVLPARGK